MNFTHSLFFVSASRFIITKDYFNLINFCKVIALNLSSSEFYMLFSNLRLIQNIELTLYCMRNNFRNYLAHTMQYNTKEWTTRIWTLSVKFKTTNLRCDSYKIKSKVWKMCTQNKYWWREIFSADASINSSKIVHVALHTLTICDNFK